LTKKIKTYTRLKGDIDRVNIDYQDFKILEDLIQDHKIISLGLASEKFIHDFNES